MKPARLQVDVDSIPDDKPPQTGHTFNIWYLQWAGGDPSGKNYIQLKFRVDIGRDSGSTRGQDDKSPICLFFARGCCYKGKKCRYLHRLPTDKDHWPVTQDCFGRDKLADYNDDMSGVGLLTRTNCTLYVGGLHMNNEMEETLTRHFAEFGSIDKIRVLPSKSCAFIKYRLESEAQFAKEAMQAQTLNGKDILDIKWANDDPNPEAQKNAKRELENEAVETVKRLLGDTKRVKRVIGHERNDLGNEGNVSKVKTNGLLGDRLLLLKKARQRDKDRGNRDGDENGDENDKDKDNGNGDGEKGIVDGYGSD